MKLAEMIVVALHGLTANRLRSLLTMLGILIGVGAVILLVAVGTGSSKSVQDRIQGLGTNTLTVLKSGGGFGGGFGGARGNTGTQTSSFTLTATDVNALLDKEANPDIGEVAPTVSGTSQSASYNGNNHDIGTFTGTTPNYLEIRNYEVESGAAFSNDDVSNRNRTVIIGETVAEELFGTQDPVGKQLKIASNNWTVTGVLKEKGSNGAQDEDDIIIAPVTTMQDLVTGKTNGYNSIVVQATSSSRMDAASSEITDTLNNLHPQTGRTTSQQFQVLNQASLLETSQSTNRVFTVLLGAVAAISLLVGGIGVMNIMLVTVTERTREIGIRKAIGARRIEILGQFLAESVLLSVLGGLLGVAAGLIGSQFKIVGVEPVVAPYSVALAFGVALAVGVFFGLYPANRAARLRPIEALRYE